ncbi:MAG TPA: hypothetical protein VEZ55_12595, partial [Chitinophagaceae bacterium]|nr:hypothetical protein [Chitinophagaceae bacterium]
MKKLCLAVLILTVINQGNAQVIDIEKLPKAKPFDWNGSIGANTTIYSVKGIENRSNPFSWNIHGNVNAKIMETLDLPFAFSINKFQSSFSKPNLQFGITPKYKWAMLHLGHRNLTF